VEASALSGGGRGYFVLANHSADTLKTRVTSTLQVRDVKQLDAAGSRAVAGDQQGWMVELPPYSGAILEWRQP
jgi:hypothetical protein